jgi:hypothetical protein
MTKEEFAALIPEPDWVEWYAMTPAQRFLESEKLWQHYLEMGGSLDEEPDESGGEGPEGWQEFLAEWWRESIPRWRSMSEGGAASGQVIDRALGDHDGRTA